MFVGAWRRLNAVFFYLYCKIIKKLSKIIQFDLKSVHGWRNFILKKKGFQSF